jgi:hypothetical protein
MRQRDEQLSIIAQSPFMPEFNDPVRWLVEHHIVFCPKPGFLCLFVPAELHFF